MELHPSSRYYSGAADHVTEGAYPDDVPGQVANPPLRQAVSRAHKAAAHLDDIIERLSGRLQPIKQPEAPTPTVAENLHAVADRPRSELTVEVHEVANRIDGAVDRLAHLLDYLDL